MSLASRGVGAMAAAALLLTAVLVFIANQYAFSDASIVSARTVLIAGLAATALILLVRPLSRLKKRGVADEVERSVPAFDGRVETFVDANRRVEDGAPRSPLLDLLAADALRVAETSPPNEVVTGGRIAAFAGLGVVSLAILLWLGTAGPGYWGYGTERLWAGWLKTDTTPLYDMLVEPGDAVVRSGAGLKVRAELIGLDTDSLVIAAQYESSVDWERAPMAPRMEGSGFEFTFVGVTEPFTYYVSGGGMESERFRVDVVEMPDVENVKLTYAFPKWTGLDPIVEDPGGDIRAVTGSRVTVEVTTDRELVGGVLIVETEGEERVTLDADGLNARAEIEVSADGSYYVAAMYDGQPVRLTEDFFITATPDEAPTVKIKSPGRDWKATNIEEVTAELEAVDDFGLRGMELHYSVNGGEFEKVAVGGGGQKANREHTFYLEDFRSVDVFAVEEIPPAMTPLKPGDLVSYYVVARDHAKSSRTDMYFIEIQPFDRRFSQSQQAGGGMQGGQQQQDEISKRQKQIIASTWNLIQERQEGGGRSREEIREAARLLSELQLTLRDQANTLAERTRARQLTETNETFRLFVEHLELAAKAMEPASDKLASYDLNDALAPEQKALQHVLRAEALFTDIQVAMQQGGGGGGGGAGRDLTEMFELEMDLEKNQYETGGGASSQQQLETEIDDAFKKLEELAKRQEQLAEQAENKDAQSFAERWQQEMLRREAEELKRELEQLQRRSQNQQQAQNQQGSQGSQSQSGQSGQQGQQGGQSRQQQQMLDRAIERLERATSEMQQSAQQQQGGQQGSQQQGSQQQQGQQGGQQGAQQQQQRAAAAQRAQQQLNQALSELTQQRKQQNTGQLGELARQAEQLVDRQEKVQPQLEDALRKALAEMKAAEEAGKPRSVPSGLSRQQERALSAEKSEMFENLETLQREAQQAVRRMRDSQPGASRQLRESLSELQQSEVGPKLQKAADYIRRGGAPYVASSEESVSSALREFRDGLRDAERAAREGGGERGRPDLERALSDMQELRRQLEEAAGLGNQSGEQGGGQQQAQQGGPGQQQQGQQSGQGGGQQGQQGQGQQGQQGQGQQGQGQQSAQAGSQPGQQPGGQQPGSQGQSGQQPGQGQQGTQPGQGQGGQGGSGQITEQANGGQNPGTQGRGSSLSRRGGPSTGPSGSNYGDWEPARSWQDLDPQTIAEIRRRIEEVAGEVPQLTNRLRRSGVFEEDLQQLRNYARGLDSGRFQGNPELVEREVRELTALLEQLELQVRRQVETDEGGEVRSLVSQPVPEEYREAVAEYFRKLSEGAPE